MYLVDNHVHWPGGGGYCHIKMLGVLVVPFRGQKCGFGTS